jgi:hypothetical protein
LEASRTGLTLGGRVRNNPQRKNKTKQPKNSGKDERTVTKAPSKPCS